MAGFHDVASDRENDHMRTLNLPAAGQSSSYVFGEMGSRRSTVIPLTLITGAVSSTSLFYHGDGSKQILRAKAFQPRRLVPLQAWAWTPPLDGGLE